jgi:hypothetical protein
MVDRAEKELTIEDGLRKIEKLWAGMSLSFAPYQVNLLSFLFHHYQQIVHGVKRPRWDQSYGFSLDQRHVRLYKFRAVVSQVRKSSTPEH